MQILLKNRLQFLATFASTITDAMALKFLSQARAWFLKVEPVQIVSMYVCVCVCVCVCVRPQGY